MSIEHDVVDSDNSAVLAKARLSKLTWVFKSTFNPEVLVRRFLSLMVILSLYSWFGLGVQAWAASAFDEKVVADFYRGKTVRIVVGFSAGGGYDAYSRVIGRHLHKHIPGNPSVIVDNMAGAKYHRRQLHIQCRAERRHGDRQHQRPNYS